MSASTPPDYDPVYRFVLPERLLQREILDCMTTQATATELHTALTRRGHKVRRSTVVSELEDMCVRGYVAREPQR